MLWVSCVEQTVGTDMHRYNKLVITVSESAQFGQKIA